MKHVCIGALNHFDSNRISIVLEEHKIDFFLNLLMNLLYNLDGWFQDLLLMKNYSL
jgi:hypothetical protein